MSCPGCDHVHEQHLVWASVVDTVEELVQRIRGGVRLMEREIAESEAAVAADLEKLVAEHRRTAAKLDEHRRRVGNLHSVLDQLDLYVGRIRSDLTDGIDTMDYNQGYL